MSDISGEELERLAEKFRTAMDKIFAGKPPHIMLGALTRYLVECVVAGAKSKKHAERYARLVQAGLSKVWDERQREGRMSHDNVTPIQLSDLLPTAHSFQLAVCDDPKCGVHLVSLDKNMAPMCQTVISRNQLTELMGAFNDILNRGHH